MVSWWLSFPVSGCGFLVFGLDFVGSLLLNVGGPCGVVPVVSGSVCRGKAPCRVTILALR